jgi:hypothetical protein
MKLLHRRGNGQMPKIGKQQVRVVSHNTSGKGAPHELQTPLGPHPVHSAAHEQRLGINSPGG